MPSNLQVSHLFDVHGLIAVVTGGGTGIGAMIAKSLSANGAAAVYILGRRIDPLKEVAMSNSNIHPIICDVTSKPHLQAAVDEITKKSSHVDVLVCNAGMAPPTPKPQPTETSSISEVRNYFFSTLSTEDHATVLNLNNTAVMVTTFAFLELLDAANKRNHVEGTGRVRSQVIAVGSAGAFFRRGSDFVYNASKAATTHLIKQMATFLVPWDIRCNIIEPGWFLSQITADFAKQFEKDRGVMPKAYVPQQRFGNEEEMAGTIIYMASRAGGYLNGSVLLVDGGTLSIHPCSY